MARQAGRIFRDGIGGFCSLLFPGIRRFSDLREEGIPRYIAMFIDIAGEMALLFQQKK
jgi:hypothetical protein